ncbi:hypothetical protein ES288_A11G352300v1 [Gossypium darwinii]|uniref:Uncharacterized protein n=1 Tax=Gossypium darwinii TaxID=34276 RepID=A0A5D2ET47_GOSDA|nr:hypothetical protein ES288_A11G352300v1 [Gossypium darwinii]
MAKKEEMRLRKAITFSSCGSEPDELRRMALKASKSLKSDRPLSRQLSMCEASRDIAWERRRQQMLKQQQRERKGIDVTDGKKLTDEDLHELKGSIELGFGFEEEQGQKLCQTLPALDLYFAVNRQVSSSPVSSPHDGGPAFTPSCNEFESPRSVLDWKICNPGDNPQQVKTNLRHWAQAVACAVMQSY